MGTRVEGFVDYHLPGDFQTDPRQILQILSASIPACLTVEQYWRTNDTWHEPDSTDAWRILDTGDLPGPWLRGPGGMDIQFFPRVATIFAAARWRGFLTIPAMRQVHRSAFTAIGQAVGATGIIIVPDYAAELIDAAAGGSTFEDCLRLAEDRWGPVQGDLNEISEPVIRDCEHHPPQVWYLELL